MTGRKDDHGKPQMRLLPWVALVAVAQVMTWAIEGKENPYPAGNWKKVEPDRYKDALGRHLAAYFEDDASTDDESGLSHLSHAACCVLMLLWFQKKGIR